MGEESPRPEYECANDTRINLVNGSQLSLGVNDDGQVVVAIKDVGAELKLYLILDRSQVEAWLVSAISMLAQLDA